MIIFGIDPGKAGGLAAVDGSTTAVMDIKPMPIAGKDLDLEAITKWFCQFMGEDCKAYIEKVGAMPGQGVTSMFTFGYGVGAIHGILASLMVPRYLVTPQAWKKEVLVGTAKDKLAAIDWCNRTYPGVSLILPRCKKPHDGMADAVCIAEYGRRQK